MTGHVLESYKGIEVASIKLIYKILLENNRDIGEVGVITYSVGACAGVVN